MSKEVLRVKDLGKVFQPRRGAALTALERVSLEAGENDFLCVVGPSGCGKSTLLRIMAGLEAASSGQVLYHGQPLTRPHPRVGLVFQEYSLLPWRDVLDNVTLGPEFAGQPTTQRQALGLEQLRLVGLEQFAQAMPHELSGGMRQRVAIARALANGPDLLLMDEPFGALDAHTRILLQRELLRVWQASRATIVFVTHGVDEAGYLADHIVVMSARPGRVLEVLAVDLERPRRRDDPSFGRLTSLILDMLEAEAVP
jgi:ABC-type nitrate/sulfonate/bicarbonate transport system ATPase subunit